MNKEDKEDKVLEDWIAKKKSLIVYKIMLSQRDFTNGVNGVIRRDANRKNLSHL